MMRARRGVRRTPEAVDGDLSVAEARSILQERLVRAPEPSGASSQRERVPRAPAHLQHPRHLLGGLCDAPLARGLELRLRGPRGGQTGRVAAGARALWIHSRVAPLARATVPFRSFSFRAARPLAFRTAARTSSLVARLVWRASNWIDCAQLASSSLRAYASDAYRRAWPRLCVPRRRGRWRHQCGRGPDTAGAPRRRHEVLTAG
ncbi:hypothetical protein M885DRAFT_72040 [Pelagophyceae sp. CCMP2097]|nr:hypothetical protein M885DRAFT_72040 [Pelagophyceae sp. CCMP2097]